MSNARPDYDDAEEPVTAGPWSRRVTAAIRLRWTEHSPQGTARYDMDVVLLSSHAHQHLQRFQAFLFDGTTPGTTPFYESDTWDSPAIDYQSPPIHLTQDQGIAFQCLNQAPPDTPVMLAQGGADTANEHCVLYAGWAYPAGTHLHQIPAPMIALSSTNGGSASFIDSTDLPSPF